MTTTAAEEVRRTGVAAYECRECHARTYTEADAIEHAETCTRDRSPALAYCLAAIACGPLGPRSIDRMTAARGLWAVTIGQELAR